MVDHGIQWLILGSFSVEDPALEGKISEIYWLAKTCNHILAETTIVPGGGKSSTISSTIASEELPKTNHCIPLALHNINHCTRHTPRS